MIRSDIVEALAEQFSQLTNKDSESAVKTILDAMSDALVRGHRIEIRGFGSFSINRRPPRMGRNPRTGESVAIAENAFPTSSRAKPCAKRSTGRTTSMSPMPDRTQRCADAFRIFVGHFTMPGVHASP